MWCSLPIIHHLHALNLSQPSSSKTWSTKSTTRNSRTQEPFTTMQQRSVCLNTSRGTAADSIPPISSTYQPIGCYFETAVIPEYIDQLEEVRKKLAHRELPMLDANWWQLRRPAFFYCNTSRAPWKTGSTYRKLAKLEQYGKERISKPTLSANGYSVPQGERNHSGDMQIQPQYLAHLQRKKSWIPSWITLKTLQ